jgi:hypothetical protein
MKFTEQTGNDWYEWEEWIETDVQLCVVFTVEEESNTRPHCSECGYEWSAMLGENEVPTKCECGGEVTLP